MTLPHSTSAPVVLPDEATPDTGHGESWIVVVFDNDYNTWDEVVAILMIATRCSLEEAHIETWEVHHLGRSVVHQADEETCRSVCAVIATIGIRVEVTRQ